MYKDSMDCVVMGVKSDMTERLSTFSQMDKKRRHKLSLSEIYITDLRTLILSNKTIPSSITQQLR